MPRITQAQLPRTVTCPGRTPAGVVQQGLPRGSHSLGRLQRHQFKPHKDVHSLPNTIRKRKFLWQELVRRAVPCQVGGHTMQFSYHHSHQKRAYGSTNSKVYNNCIAKRCKRESSYYLLQKIFTPPILTLPCLPPYCAATKTAFNLPGATLSCPLATSPPEHTLHLLPHFQQKLSKTLNKPSALGRTTSHSAPTSSPACAIPCCVTHKPAPACGGHVLSG